MTAIKRTTYFTDEVQAVLGIDRDGAESFSGRAGFLICAAGIVATENSPELTADEWCAIVDSNNGSLFAYEQGPEVVVRGIIHNVFDSAEEEDEKWGVSCEDLARKLGALTFAEQLAVFEITRAFWTRKEAQEGASGYREIFERLGAKVTPASDEAPQ